MNEPITKFKIGLTSKLVGLAPETIRYYERKGIIQPEKVEQSNYRLYDIRDVCVLGRARTYLQYGFSLEEARRMLFEENISGVAGMLNGKAEQLEQQIIDKMNTLQGIRRKQAAINNTIASIGSYRVVERPAMYLVEMFRENVPLSDRGVQTAYVDWLDKQIFTYPYVRYVPSEDSNELKVYVGQAIEAEDVQRANIRDLSCVTYLPPRASLYTGLKMRQQRVPDAEDPLQKVFAYMEENKLKKSGDVLTKTVNILRDERGCFYYRDVWVDLA